MEKKLKEKIIVVKKIGTKAQRRAKYILANKYRRELVKNQTNPEKVFQYILDQLGVKYKFQFIVYPEKSFFILDFFIPEYNLIIEVDGKHHYTQEGLTKDSERDNLLVAMGYTVKRFKNDEVFNARKCERRIKSILGLGTKGFF